MKLFPVLTAIMLTVGCVCGEIRNGYEGRLLSSQEALQKLRLRLSQESDLSSSERRQLRSGIARLVRFISYCELTQEVLARLRVISPDLYNEMDCLTDRKGRPTDIFIRLIPKDEARVYLRAASFLTQAARDSDTCVSEYGDHSVAVDICISERALALLCHELGHISYIVPNLAVYSRFYVSTYARVHDLNFIGHDTRDQSGKLADAFEDKFRADYSAYLRSGAVRPEPVLSTLIRLKRKNREVRREMPRQDDWPLPYSPDDLKSGIQNHGSQ